MKVQRFKSLSWGLALLACAGAAPLAGCGPTRLNVKADIPPLLMVPLPLAMGVRIPKTFAVYVQKETGQDRQWEINLGVAQADAIRRVTAAMFEHTLVLGDQVSGDARLIAEYKLNAILETTLDSYVYLLPSSGGADFFSATIGYKVNLESVDGNVLGSWIYEGYGSAPSRGLGDAEGVKLVTGLAIRDACANLAVHLSDQELIRNLLPAPVSTPTPTPESSPAAAPLMPTQVSSPASTPLTPMPESSAAPTPPPAPTAADVQAATGT